MWHSALEWNSANNALRTKRSEPFQRHFYRVSIACDAVINSLLILHPLILWPSSPFAYPFFVPILRFEKLGFLKGFEWQLSSIMAS
jgi:hypothetical protein